MLAIANAHDVLAAAASACEDVSVLHDLEALSLEPPEEEEVPLLDLEALRLDGDVVRELPSLGVRVVIRMPAGAPRKAQRNLVRGYKAVQARNLRSVFDRVAQTLLDLEGKRARRAVRPLAKALRKSAKDEAPSLALVEALLDSLTAVIDRAPGALDDPTAAYLNKAVAALVHDASLFLP